MNLKIGNISPHEKNGHYMEHLNKKWYTDWLSSDIWLLSFTNFNENIASFLMNVVNDTCTPLHLSYTRNRCSILKFPNLSLLCLRVTSYSLLLSESYLSYIPLWLHRLMIHSHTKSTRGLPIVFSIHLAPLFFSWCLEDSVHQFEDANEKQCKAERRTSPLRPTSFRCLTFILWFCGIVLCWHVRSDRNKHTVVNTRPRVGVTWHPF